MMEIETHVKDCLSEKTGVVTAVDKSGRYKVHMDEGGTHDYLEGEIYLDMDYYTKSK